MAFPKMQNVAKVSMGLQTLLITQWVKMRNSGEERMTLETVFIHLRLAIYILWLVNHIWSRGLWKTYQHKSSGTVHGLLKILQKKEREPIYLFPVRMLGCYFGLVFKWLQMSRLPPVPVPRLSQDFLSAHTFCLNLSRYCDIICFEMKSFASDSVS